MSTPVEPTPEAIVDLRGVTVRQGNYDVLRAVDLRVAGGEFVYLVGKTGAGKSSLLKTLYGALPPAGGQATVAGFDLRKLNRRRIPKLRRQLGIVFQDLNLLPDRDVAGNLDFALRATGWRVAKKRAARAAEVLAAVGMTDKLNARVHTLSGGERQRVAFARALLNQPRLLIADEVTGNLDPDTSVDTLNLMRQLAAERGAAVIFATHDYRLLDTFQARVVRCAGGRLFNAEQ